MFKLFDPNETIKHVPYRVLKAQYKRDMERTDSFFRAVIRISLLSAVIMGLLFYVSQYM